MMATDAFVEDGTMLLAKQLQAAEVDRLIQASADFEFAFRMQLTEALHASAASAAPMDANDNAIDVVDVVSEDRQFAITEQRQEQLRLNQEMEDEKEARKEQSRLAEINEVSRQDARFARRLSGVSDREWLERGEYVSDPYVQAPSHDVGNDFENQRNRDPWRSPISSLICQGAMWEPAVAAAFLLDGADNPNGKTYLATTKFVFHNDGESSSKSSVCGICLETAISSHNAMVTSDKCMHLFCIECLGKYGEAMVKSGKFNIRCPEVGCEQVWSEKMTGSLLSPGDCLILSQRQIEHVFAESERVYCPFADCSAMLLKPELADQPSSSGHPHQTSVGGVECFECNRLFCFECQVPWHGDLSCEEFQAVSRNERSADDIHLEKLAKHKRWQRCKQCGHMVELRSGCHHITCRCGSDFCYVCGDSWASGHICRT